MNGTPAGWHADPYGRHEQRYFDGDAWSEHVADGGQQGSDPVGADTPVLAPSTPAPTAQVYPRAQPVGATPTIIVKHRSPWPWIFLAIFLVFGLGIVGCVAIVAVATDNAVKSFNAEQSRHAISQGQFDSVQLGTARAAVIAGLGKQPENTQSFSSQAANARIDSSCIYYWESGRTFGHYYQFCFDGTGNLSTKNAF